MTNYGPRTSDPLSCATAMDKSNDGDLLFNPLEWEYFAEGGKHAAFTGPRDNKNDGRVLRIRKDDIQGKADGSHAAECFYTTTVISPLFGSYFDEPTKVDLDQDIVDTLRRRALENGRIPESRLQSWEKADRPAVSDPFATLHWNYRRLLPFDCGPCWSIELKPKAGYTAFSPLVDPDHNAKFRFTRFHILQQLAAKGVLKKGWATSSTRPSSYDPLDLFSGEAERQRRALEVLLDNPQNNIKMWWNEIPIVGLRQPSLSPEKKQTCTQVLRLVQLVLSEENILSRLRRLQLLDVLDADGAVLVYSRLVDLCGTQELAETLLDSVTECIQPPDDNKQSYLVSSPFRRPECEGLDNLIRMVDDFADYLPHPSGKHETFHAQAVCCIEGLSKDACVYLLQNWLLSLVANDVSVFITLCPQEGSQLELSPLLHAWSIDRKQAASSPGRIVEASGLEFLYLVKLVDCEAKPSRKLRERRKTEALTKFFEETA